MLNRELQREILTKLREAYPEVADLSSFLDITNRNNQANLFYLAEHNLIAPEAMRRAMGVPRQMLTAQITAEGLDFLEDDGGLGAILNVVTVKMDAENLKAILEARINESDIPSEQKQSVIEKIRGFSGDVLKAVIIKLVEKGIEKPEQVGNIINVISKF